VDRPNLIGVVTVTYNSARVIRAFMDCLLVQTHSEFSLYLIDNASSDETLKLLADYRDPRVNIIRNRDNVGVAEGNNLGIRAALKDGCRFVLLLNNDTVFDCDLLSKLVQGLREHNSDMVVPKILFFDEPDKIWSAGGYFSALRGNSKHFGFGEKDDGRFDLPRAVGYNPTCCMLIKQEVFDRVGLMDANYFVYFDDTDFCLRAYRAGVKLFYLPTARLKHKVSSLTGGMSSFTLRYCVRNQVYYVLKNYSVGQGFFYCVALSIYIPGKYFFFLRSPKTFWTAQKAFWEGILLFVSNMERSKRTLEPTRVQ
jgi:GT2 family glycosyltransferase